MRRDSGAPGPPGRRPAALKFFARATSTNSVMSCSAERSFMAALYSIIGKINPGAGCSLPRREVRPFAHPNTTFQEIPMKAIRLQAFGAADQLELRDVPVPVAGPRE